MILIIIFLLLANLSYSQESPPVKIRIIDRSTKNPIPFATAKSAKYNSGTFADADGVINVTRNYLGDSAVISSVGFFDTTIALDKQFSIIELQPDYKILPSVNVTNLKYKASNTLGSLEAKNTFAWTSSGMGDCFVKQFAFQDSGKIHKLNTISIVLTRYFEDFPVTLHIRGSKNGNPSNSIITNSIAATKANYNKKTKTLVFNIEKENILVDDTLIFIGLEVLPYEISKERPRSIAIAMNDTEEQNQTFVKTYTNRDNGWKPAPRLLTQKKPSNIIVLLNYDIYDEHK